MAACLKVPIFVSSAWKKLGQAESASCCRLLCLGVPTAVCLAEAPGRQLGARAAGGLQERPAGRAPGLPDPAGRVLPAPRATSSAEVHLRRPAFQGRLRQAGNHGCLPVSVQVARAATH